MSENAIIREIRELRARVEQMWKREGLTVGSGGMLASTYDPGTVGADAFDTDNHHDGAVNGVYTLAERENLADLMTGLLNEGDMVYRGLASNVATTAAGASVVVIDT